VFSKKTGDYTTLSETDREIIALAVEMAYNKNKGHLIRKDPPPMTEWIPKSNYKQKNEFFEVKGKADTETKPEENDASKPEETKQEQADAQSEPVKTTEIQQQTESKPVETTTSTTAETKQTESVQQKDEPKESKTEEKSEIQKTDDQTAPKESQESKAKESDKKKKDLDEDDDGEGEWITPSNVAKHIYKGESKNKTLDELGIAIMTTDFAMQVRSVAILHTH